MNYHSKILSLFIGIFAFATILSCNDCDPKNYTCTYDSFKTTNLKITKYSNGTISSQGTFSDSLLKDSFGIFLSFHYKILANNDLKSFSFFSEAKAKCAENTYNPIESISSVEIKTLFDYDSLHPANSDVSSCFGVPEWNNLLSIPQSLIKRNANPRSNYGMGDAFGIIPFNSPIFTGLQSFQVKVKLSDGRNFTSITDTIFLK